MEIDSLAQLRILLQALLLGWTLGLLYDLLGAVRRRLQGTLAAALLDGAYSLTLFLLVFSFALRAGGGELRVFLLAGLAVGMLFFFALCSAPLRPIWDLWVEAALRLLRLAVFPLRFLLGGLKYFLRRVKKLFHFFRKCYIIIFRKQGGSRSGRRKGRSHGRS